MERGGGVVERGVKEQVLTAVFGHTDHVSFMYWSWLYVLLLVYNVE